MPFRIIFASRNQYSRPLMKKLLLALALVAAQLAPTYAQTFPVEKSASFKAPSDGYNKLMQLNNGNTFYFHFSRKEGVVVKVYNKERALVNTQKLEATKEIVKTFGKSTVQGVYEISGKPVMFLQRTVRRKTNLVRFIFDPNTGRNTQTDTVCELPEYVRGASFAMAFGDVDPINAFIEKDANSDCYAVVSFDGFAHESGERIQVLHFDGNHKLLNKAYYVAPENKYKYLRYLGMTVDGAKQVFIATYGFNTGKQKDSRVIMSRLKSDEKEFAHNMLDFSEDFKKTSSVMKYNSGTGLIELMTLTYVESKTKMFQDAVSYYLTVMSYIDPATLKLTNLKPFEAKLATYYATEQLKQKKGMGGMPQEVRVNKDHSTVAITEEMRTIVKSSKNGSTVHTRLGGIAISELDEKGEEKYGYAIIKSQYTRGYFPKFYSIKREKGYWRKGFADVGEPSGSAKGSKYTHANSFMSFDYIDGAKGHYVLFNELKKNAEKDPSDSRKKVVKAKKLNTLCYKLDNGKLVQSYLFGAPETKKTEKYVQIDASNYAPQTNTYASIMMERLKGKRECKIAWVKFE